MKIEGCKYRIFGGEQITNTLTNNLNNMELAIEKLRAMQQWFDLQSEYFNERFKTLKQLEMVFDYARENNLSFCDDDYLYSECTEKERINFYKFLDTKVFKKNYSK